MATDESTSSCSEAESKCNASVLVAGSQSFVDNVTSLTLLTDEQNVCSAQVFSTVVYDACDTPVACDANPATVAAILETEGKIHNALRKMLINIKKLPDDIVDELLKKFVLMYRYSFERCINLPPPEGLEGEEPLAALRHHLSFRLDQWNEWHGDKGIDRLLGRNFTDPNGENKARMGDDEAAGLQQMKERVMGIEKERMIEAEKKKKELMMSEAKILNEEQAKKLAKAKKSEERRLARAERTKKKKWQKEIEFLKAVTLEQVVGNVPLGVLKIYKAKCHLCEDRLTDAKYLSMHVKIRHPAVYFCHYCDRTFASHGPLRVHCEVLHPGVPIDPEGRRPPERANCTNGSIQTSRNLADDERGLISMMRGSTTETEDDEQDLAPVLTPASDLSNDVRRMFESKMSMEYGDAGSKDEQSSPLMSSMPQLEAMEHGSRESDIRGSSLPPIHTELEAAMELSQLQIHGAMYKERGIQYSILGDIYDSARRQLVMIGLYANVKSADSSTNGGIHTSKR
ncbi:hypothetical protein AB6A40_007495 [Gnathostoma spinigerum]|uniref:C2H2-type domain-containing protein n=1 Tax=Gnathostoma spinigerum TaxID=75299 RepID=A0ABD6ETK7_9BILA